MKRMFMLSAMMMAMFMASVDTVAQTQGRGRAEARVERGGRNDRMRQPERTVPRDHGRRNDRMRRPPQPPKLRGHRTEHIMPRNGRLVACQAPRVKRGHYVPGWEGRVRYLGNGRWAYLFDGRWVAYDCYYNPYDYFCVPVSPCLHPYPVY